MKLYLALRHVLHEDLGLFADPLRRRGYEIRYVDTPVEPLDAVATLDADLLVVLGGPVGAYEGSAYPWLEPETAALRSRLDAGRPTLGVCLGAQLMATALGARVEPGAAPEIGWARMALSDAGTSSPLAVLAGLPVLHWHGDRLDLPEGAVGLASTSLCPQQAFAVGRHALALQFHAEVDPAMIERWIIADAGALAAVGITPDAMRRETERHGPPMRRAAPALIDAWLDGLSWGGLSAGRRSRSRC